MGELTTASAIDAFVRTVAALVQDRDDVRRVAVRPLAGDPRGVLRSMVDVLNGQARPYGKTVYLVKPEA